MLGQTAAMDPQPPPKRAQQILTYILLGAIFGIVLPWWKGLDFLDPVLLSAYACMGFIFSAPAAAQAMAERPKSPADAVRRIAVAVAVGEVIALGLLFCGIATVYATHRITFFPADPLALGWTALLGLTGSLALSAMAAWIAIAFSANAARSALRFVLLALLLAFYLRGRWLPVIAIQGSVAAAVLAGVFVALALASLKKTA